MGSNIKRLLLITKDKRLKLMILVLFYVWEDARIWAHWSYSLDLHLNYLGPVSCFSSSKIPFIEYWRGWLQWPMTWWWAAFVVYWNDRQQFFIGTGIASWDPHPGSHFGKPGWFLMLLKPTGKWCCHKVLQTPGKLRHIFLGYQFYLNTWGDKG